MPEVLQKKDSDLPFSHASSKAEGMTLLVKHFDPEQNISAAL